MLGLKGRVSHDGPSIVAANRAGADEDVDRVYVYQHAASCVYSTTSRGVVHGWERERRKPRL